MTQASDPASVALAKCEAIMHKLGAQMTFGGEVEWYMIPNKKFSEPLEVTRDKLIEEVKKNPATLIGLEKLDLSLANISQMQSTVKRDEGKTISSGQAVVRIFQETYSDAKIQRKKALGIKSEHMISEEIRLAATIAKTYRECAETGIKLNKDFKDEAGGVHRYTPDDTTVNINQYEFSTEVANAPTTAKWLDQARDILAKNSKEFGLTSDFHDKPSYTTNLSSPGSGMHVHYGLITAGASKTNLMRHGIFKNRTDNGSKVYEACANGVSEVLQQGGTALCCSSNNAYKRIGGYYVASRVGAGHDNSYTIESASCGGVLHQELRLPGANTKGSHAVLVAALGMVHGVTQELGLGKTPKDRIDPWRTRLGFDEGTNDKLDEILGEIQPSHAQALLKLSKQRHIFSSHEKGNVPTTLAEAKERGRRGSLLQSYCPLVVQEIEALSGKTNKWNL